MMILHKACPLDGFAEVRIIAHVNIRTCKEICRLSEFVGIHHLCTLEDLFKSDAAVIGDLEFLVAALLRGHLDDACSTTATVLGCLGGIFQDGETLNVGRVDGGEDGQVCRYTIDDDERVVLARQRGCTTYTHCRDHGLLVSASGDLHSCSLSAQSIQ